MLLCGIPDIDVVDWKTYTEYLGGYKRLGAKHKNVRWFWSFVEGCGPEEKARLLQVRAWIREYGNMGIWEYGNSLKMGCVVRLEGYLSVMLLPCSITTGALGSPGLLLSYSIITISLNIIIILTMRCLHVFLHLYIYISTMRSVHHRVLKTPSSRI